MLDKEAIKAILPHRDPFLFVDEVNELRPLKFAKGKKYVDPKLDFFKGHFPGEPVMPGVLIIEAMAQIGAVAVLSDESFKNAIAYFVKADDVKFRQKVLPGDTLDLECEIFKVRARFGKGKGRAYVNGELVAEGIITFAIE